MHAALSFRKACFSAASLRMRGRDFPCGGGEKGPFLAEKSAALADFPCGGEMGGGIKKDPDEASGFRAEPSHQSKWAP